LKAFESATEQDLAAIDEQIGFHQKKVDGLSAARKVLGKKFGVIGGPSEKAQKMARTMTMRNALVKFLYERQNRAARKAEIVQALSLADGEYEKLIKADYFTLAPDGLILTAEGKALYQKKNK
jgi:hypothetical protein